MEGDIDLTIFAKHLFSLGVQSGFGNLTQHISHVNNIGRVAWMVMASCQFSIIVYYHILAVLTDLADDFSHEFIHPNLLPLGAHLEYSHF